MSDMGTGRPSRRSDKGRTMTIERMIESTLLELELHEAIDAIIEALDWLELEDFES